MRTYTFFFSHWIGVEIKKTSVFLCKMTIARVLDTSIVQKSNQRSSGRYFGVKRKSNKIKIKVTLIRDKVTLAHQKNTHFSCIVAMIARICKKNVCTYVWHGKYKKKLHTAGKRRGKAKNTERNIRTRHKSSQHQNRERKCKKFTVIVIKMAWVELDILLYIDILCIYYYQCTLSLSLCLFITNQLYVYNLSIMPVFIVYYYIIAVEVWMWLAVANKVTDVWIMHENIYSSYSYLLDGNNCF